MPKTRELTEVERGQIVVLEKQGLSVSAIARQVKCARSTVRMTIKRYKESGSLTNKPKTGRKRKTTSRDERVLERMSLRDRKKGSKQLSSELFRLHNVAISPRTVRRRLCELNLGGYKARHKPRLSPQQKKKRLLWAKSHRDWTIENWANVMWTDESNIEVSNT